MMTPGTHKPEKGEIVAVRNSPGELDEIRLDVVVNYPDAGPRTYENVKPLNYRRKAYTCVGPEPGDVAWCVWRGDELAFVAEYEVEYEACPESPGSLQSRPPLPGEGPSRLNPLDGTVGGSFSAGGGESTPAGGGGEA